MADDEKFSGSVSDGDTPPLEAEIDKTLEESFPASDPPSWTLGTDHHVETSEDESDGGE